MGTALHLVLHTVVMACSPSQNFLDYYIGTRGKMQAFSSPISLEFLQPSSWTLHKSISAANCSHQAAAYHASHTYNEIGRSPTNDLPERRKLHESRNRRRRGYYDHRLCHGASGKGISAQQQMDPRDLCRLWRRAGNCRTACHAGFSRQRCDLCSSSRYCKRTCRYRSRPDSKAGLHEWYLS